MTRAAEALAVSYPVVSKTISELEQTLGVKLFDRSVSGVEPTHYGRALLKSGVAVFDEMRKGLQQIDFIKQPDAGDLRIGSSIVVDAGLLPAILERFSRDFPRAVLHVIPEDIATQQYDNLRNRNVELVLGRLPATMNEPDLVAECADDMLPGLMIDDSVWILIAKSVVGRIGVGAKQTDLIRNFFINKLFECCWDNNAARLCPCKSDRN